MLCIHSHFNPFNHVQRQARITHVRANVSPCQTNKEQNNCINKSCASMGMGMAESAGVCVHV